jgi:uncharacterized damage-inducible protein DinB
VPMNQALLGEFDHEMANTRKTLERVPDDKWDWKPHAKSGTTGWLTNHLVLFPGWLASMFKSKSFDVSPGGKPAEMPKANNRQEALELFDRDVAKAREALANATDEELMETWSLLGNGQVIFSMPRIAIYRSMIMNHMIHHRAQLGVYFRLNDVAVPGIYGPSGDETAMAAAAK